MLADLMYAIGYHGFREGMFFSILHGIERLVDEQFHTFADEDNKEILISNIDREAIKDRLFASLKEVGETKYGAAPWFDKTGNPEMIMSVPIIKRLWPDAVFIFAKRRGIENIVSRMRKFPTRSLEYHCADWARNMTAWRTVRQTLKPDDFIEIDQQDMLLNPEKAAFEICKLTQTETALNRTLQELMRSTRPQETENGSASRIYSLTDTGWTDSEKAIFEAYCAEEMAQYGYSRDGLYRGEI